MTALSYTTLCINTSPSSLSSSSSINILLVRYTKIAVFSTDVCGFEKNTSVIWCCVFLRFPSRGLKTPLFRSMCPALSLITKPHGSLTPSLLRHKYHQLRPSRDLSLLSLSREYAAPKLRNTFHMSVNPKTKVTNLMFFGCLSLPDFKMSLHHHNVQHDHSTPPTTPLNFAAL